MLNLEPNQVYTITDIYPESIYETIKASFVGENCVMVGRGNCPFPRTNLSLPPNLRSAEIEMLSGSWRGRRIFLSYFSARKHPNAKSLLCNCTAYDFPHARGCGKCSN